jgi:hypothetical protein
MGFRGALAGVLCFGTENDGALNDGNIGCPIEGVAIPPMLIPDEKEPVRAGFFLPVPIFRIDPPREREGPLSRYPLAPEPNEFLAVTVKVYSTPFVRPVTRMGEETPVSVAPPGLAVTVYVLAFPLSAPGVKATDAWLLPGVATTDVGAAGRPTRSDAVTALAGPVPATFVAVTVNV